MKIPEKHHQLLYGKNIANVATINPDGSPQVTPMWVDYDRERNEILVNTALGRKKARNMHVGSKVALTVIDCGDYYKYIAIQGEVVDVTEEGAEDHINKLASKYWGEDEYPLPKDEKRILIKIKPIYVHPKE